MKFKPLIRDEVFSFLSPLHPQKIEKLVLDRFSGFEEAWTPSFNGLLAPTPEYIARAGGDYFIIERQFRRKELIFRPNVEASLTWFDNSGTQVSALLEMPWQLRLKFIGVGLYLVIAIMVQVFNLINGKPGVSGALVGALVLSFLCMVVYMRFLGECRKMKEILLTLFNGQPLEC